MKKQLKLENMWLVFLSLNKNYMLKSQQSNQMWYGSLTMESHEAMIFSYFKHKIFNNQNFQLSQLIH